MREFLSPRTIAFGRGAVAETGTIVARHAEKCLIVTSSSTSTTGSLDAVKRSLKNAGVTPHVFGPVESDPSMETIAQAAEKARKHSVDAVLGLGGGSPLDAAKATALMAVNPGTPRDYEGRAPVVPVLPVIAVPTTAGTGSEVTRAAVITDTGRKVKMALLHEQYVPTAAILDPDLCATMPPHVAAGTGLDALTHAVEAFTSALATPMTDMHALEAIRLIGSFLLPAVFGRTDPQAGENMLRAQMHAGLAFSNASVGLVHAMAHPLGARFSIPHGHANALLLSRIMEYNAAAATDRYAAVARALGAVHPGTSLTPTEQAAAGIRFVENLLLQSGLERRLSAFGVTEDALDPMVENAFAAASSRRNARATTKEDIRRLYLAAL